MRAMEARTGGEAGSAFVISILVLFVLTVLGLAMMLTTTTETDISVNFRSGEMAFFNADAALEYGKNILAAYALRDGDFRSVLPPARTSGNMNLPPETPCDPKTPGCRHYQYSIPQGGMTIYIGRVVSDLNGRLLQFDFRNPAPGDMRGDIDGDGTPDVQGTATIWVRRPLEGLQDYGALDNRHDRAILTAEGTAPNYESALTGRPAALRRLEMAIRVPNTGITGDRYADVTRGSDTESEAAGAAAGQVAGIAR